MSKTASEAVELTPRQSRFVDEYLIDLNATQAAIRAGYSAKTAEAQGSRLLSNVKVSAAIQERMNKRAERVKVDSDYVLSRLVEIDRMDVADILNDDGSVKAIKDWPKVWRTYLSGMDISEMWDGSGEEREMSGLLKKIKWPDKVKNLELIGKHIDVQAWREQHGLSNPKGGPMELKADISARELTDAMNGILSKL